MGISKLISSESLRFVHFLVITLDLIFNSATLSFMETDRHTKKLKLNNLGTTSGKKKPQAKLCVWSRSLHYLHSGWNAAADPFLLSESFILLRLLYSQQGVTHLDTLVTSVQPLPCFLYVTQRTKKKEEPEGSPTHHISELNLSCKIFSGCQDWRASEKHM